MSFDYMSDDDDYDSDLGYFVDDFSTSFDKIKKVRISDENEKITFDRRSKEEQLETASIKGNLSTLEEILSSDPNFDINTILLGYRTALMNAAFNSQSHIVSFLLQKGANPNYHCDSETPLMCACLSPSVQTISNVDCVRRLLDARATVNVGDKYAMTPLMKAVQTGKADVVQMLLTSANLEMKDRHGKTAVFFAVESNNAEILRILAAKGAQLNISDGNSNSLKSCAVNQNNPEVLAVLGDYLFFHEDNLEPSESITTRTGEDWRDLFPGILSKKPAFYFDIPALLHGMNCNRLVPLFMQSEIDLEKFLNLDEQDLEMLGISVPYERRKFLEGLVKFHTHSWNKNSVLGLTANKRKIFDAAECLTDLGSHFRIITVFKACVDYNIKRLLSENATVLKEPDLVEICDKFLNSIVQAQMELRYLRFIVSKVNTAKFPPPDLIVPNNPLSEKSFKKVKIMFCLTSALACAAFVGLKLVMNKHPF